MSIGDDDRDDGFAPDQVLARIFTGSSAAAAAETYAELARVGLMELVCRDTLSMVEECRP